MGVNNFANFAIWRGTEDLGYGSIEEMLKEAKLAAEKVPGKSVDVCFVEFDGDVDDENTKPIKGQVIISYHLLYEGKMIVTSGK